MFAAYKAHEEFLIAEVNALGQHADFEMSQSSAVESFRDTLQTLPRDTADGVKTLGALNVDSGAFTATQRKQMSQDVAAHMRSSAKITNAKSDSNKLQNHRALIETYTKTLWDTLCDARTPWDDKLGATAMHFVSVLGLKNPNDNTCKQAVAIAAACSNRPMDPESAYSQIFKFKEKVTAKRELHPCEQKYKDYPVDVSVFMKAFPKAYPEYDPPVASRVDNLNIREMVRKENMPSRNNNKAMSSHTSKRSSPSQAQSSSAGDPQHLIGSALASYLLGQSSEPPHRASLPPRPFAIMDRPGGSGPHQFVDSKGRRVASASSMRGDHEDPDALGGGLDELIETGRDVSSRKKKKGGARKKGAKKVKGGGGASSVDSEATCTNAYTPQLFKTMFKNNV
jgi:hypothetical protein